MDSYFSKLFILSVCVIAKVGFELAYFEAATQHINKYATMTHLCSVFVENNP